MKIRKVTIDNFRGIKHLELELDDVTVLIGENNSGKTAVLEALRLCLKELGPRRKNVFDSYDFHLKDADADPSSAPPIQVEVMFAETAEGEWSRPLTRKLNNQKILLAGDDGLSQVRLRVECMYSTTSRDFEHDWNFLDLMGEPLKGIPDNALTTLQNEVTYYYLAALRDAARHFDAKGPFWRPFLKDSELPEEKRIEIESKLKEVNELVVSSHTSFDRARDQLKKVQDVVPMARGDVVSIEAVPGRLFDMLAKAEIHLGTSTGAKVPVGRHGEGTQSLAVLMLFSAFLDLRDSGVPIIALEEPEAHLHPSAVRSMWNTVERINGQKLISTHSGDLLSEVDILNVRRLARTADGTSVFRLRTNELHPEETRKFNYHIRRSRGELLFARCWLLVEGETESWIFPAAARTLGVDLHRAGVRIVEYSQSDVGLLAKVANALGIAWYCVIDNDSGRTKYEPAIRMLVTAETEADRVGFPYPNAEVHLASNGYGSIYQAAMPRQNLARVTKQPTDPDYWIDFTDNLPSKHKTRVAATIALEMESRGVTGVTSEISAIINKVVGLAGAL